MDDAAYNMMLPLADWLSLLLHSTTSPPLVVMDLLAATEMSPLDLSSTSPETPPAVVLRMPFTVIEPPYTVIGPAIVASNMDTVLVLVDLPTVKLPSVLPNVQPEVENAAVNALDTDSMRKFPAPAKEALAVVGALLENTKLPALTLVAPV